MRLLFFFLVVMSSGDTEKIGGFGTLEACESYRAKIVLRIGTKSEPCRAEAMLPTDQP